MKNKDEEPVTLEHEGDPEVSRQLVHLPTPKRLPEKKTAKQIAAQAKLLQRVVKEVMVDGVHFGIIPGTSKPTLYKAGSEKLLSTFNIAVIPEILDLSTEDCIRYQVRTQGVHQHSGVLLGVGVGECSTDEEKYRWRAAVCEEEYADTDESRRRFKYRKDYSGTVVRIQQVRTEPADLANTVLKMAKKRSQIDLTLTATGASDVFTQDLDDDGNLVSRETSQARQQTTSSGPGTGTKATEKQVVFMGKRLDEVGKDIEDLKLHFEVDSLEDITMDRVNDVLDWIKS